MEESSERLANFLLQFNLKEIQSLLSEEKKNFQIIEEEFLTIHQTGQVKERLTNLKTQIMQLSYMKVIETIDSTLKIQAVCEKFKETSKNSNSTKANVITISDDDIEEKNEKKYDLLDKEIEFIIENDEIYKSAIDKQKSSIKDLSSPREELKSSKGSPQEAKEATPAKSKRDIFKRIVIPKNNQDDEEDRLLAQQYLLLAQKDKINLKNQGKRVQDQEKQLESLKRQQQEILDQIQGKKGKKYGKKDVDEEEEFEEKGREEQDDDGDGSGEEEFDDDYHKEKRRLKKLSALLSQSKSISKQGNNNKNQKLSKVIHRKNNNTSNNSASKTQKKLTDSSKKSKSDEKEYNSLTYDRSSEKINKQSHSSSGVISQPQSYTEYLAHLINVTSDNNLSIPKIFLNELFYEKRRDGLKSVGTMLTDDDKSFVVEFYEALRGELSKAEEYLLLSGELILGLVSQAQKKPPPFVLPEEVVSEEEEIVKTPKKRRIVESENEHEEEEKGKSFEMEVEQRLERNGLRNLHEKEMNEDSFECGFNVKKDKQKKIIKESQGSSNTNIISPNNNGNNRQKISEKNNEKNISEKNNEKKIIKKGIRNEIYREESDEDLRRSNEDLSIDSADARYRTNDIKTEHHDSEEQIYF